MVEKNRRKFDNLQVINSPSKSVNEISSNLVLQDLKIGERMQLLPISGKVSYAQYIGHIPGISFLVTKPKTLEAFKGQILNVRILLQGNLYTFQAEVMSINKIPTAYMHLNVINKVEKKSIREELRVSLQKEVKIDSTKPFADGTNSLKALLTGISSGGASVETPVQLGVTGDDIFLTASFRVDECEKDISIQCTICQVRGWEDTKTRELILLHGIKFKFSGEEDKAFIEKYVAQQIWYAKTCNMI